MTVAASFLITTSPDRIISIAHDVALPSTQSKFDQQLKIAGLPNTRTTFTDVAQIGPDGSLRKVKAAAPAPAPDSAGTGASAASGAAAAAGSATPSPTPWPGILAAATPSTQAAVPGSGGGGGPAVPAGAIAGAVIGALAAIVLVGVGVWYHMKRRHERELAASMLKAQQSSVAVPLGKGQDLGGAPNGGGSGNGGTPHGRALTPRDANPDKVAAMLAAMKADAARSRSQRLPSQSLEEGQSEFSTYLYVWPNTGTAALECLCHSHIGVAIKCYQCINSYADGNQNNGIF